MNGVYEQVIRFPDTGIYWYHPHTRDDFEQELGEYGTFLVYDPDKKPVYDTESVIVLDDILIEDGKIAPFESASSKLDPVPNLMKLEGKNFLQPVLHTANERPHIVTGKHLS